MGRSGSGFHGVIIGMLAGTMAIMTGAAGAASHMVVGGSLLADGWKPQVLPCDPVHRAA